jgi:hypothetical protein
MNRSNFSATVLFALIALALTSSAQIIPISGQALVSVSGSATVPSIYGGQSQSYSVVHSTSVPYATFSDSVSGDAFAEITILPPFELYLGTTLHASSSASQTSTVGSNTIALNSSVSADAWMYSQVGSRSSSARSLTDVVFRMDETVVFNLTASGNHFQSASPYTTSVYTTSLTSEDGTIAFQFTHAFPGTGSNAFYDFNLSTPMQGILTPGIYHFRSDINAIALSDPLGEAGRGRVSLQLSVASVPESGMTFSLMVIALFALSGIRALASRDGAE